MNDPRVALSQINLRPSAFLPQTLDQYAANLSTFATTDPKSGPDLEDAVFAGVECAYGFDRSERADRKSFVYQDGFAVIPIHGALLNRFAYSWGFVTGYQAIRRQLNAALEDDDVKTIIFDVDSPGGAVAGNIELADEIRASREIKPSLAVVDAVCASAAMPLASAATQVVAIPSARIGSIGVYVMHMDVSGAMEKAGVKVSYIEAPEDGMKTSGTPFRALSDSERAEFQASVNKSYDRFVACLTANRGISDSAVRETKGRVFDADEALALGLIDAVRTPSEAVSSFLAELADDDTTEEDEDMNAKTGTVGSTAAAPAAAAPATTTTEVASAPSADAIQTAIAADRQRVASIKALPESAKLPKLADQLALSGASVEDAKASLTAAIGDLPEPAAAAPAAGATAAAPVDGTNHLAAAMGQTEQPNVGAGTGTGQAAAPGQAALTDDQQAAAILGDHSAVTGRRYEDAK